MLLGMSKNALGFDLHVSAAPVSHSKIYQQLAEDLKQVRDIASQDARTEKDKGVNGHHRPHTSALDTWSKGTPVRVGSPGPVAPGLLVLVMHFPGSVVTLFAALPRIGASVTIQMDGKWTTVGKKDTRKEKQRSDPKSEDAPNQPDTASQSAFASLDIDWKKQQGGTTLLLIRLGSDTVCNSHCLCR